jgi:hypothetical protein
MQSRSSRAAAEFARIRDGAHARHSQLDGIHHLPRVRPPSRLHRRETHVGYCVSISSGVVTAPCTRTCNLLNSTVFPSPVVTSNAPRLEEDGCQTPFTRTLVFLHRVHDAPRRHALHIALHLHVRELVLHSTWPTRARGGTRESVQLAKGPLGRTPKWGTAVCVHSAHLNSVCKCDEAIHLGGVVLNQHLGTRGREELGKWHRQRRSQPGWELAHHLGGRRVELSAACEAPERGPCAAGGPVPRGVRGGGRQRCSCVQALCVAPKLPQRLRTRAACCCRKGVAQQDGRAPCGQGAERDADAAHMVSAKTKLL